MRRRPSLAIAIVVGTLILSTVVPAHAAHVRLRLYQGHTSQGGRIWFDTTRNEEGRFVKRLSLTATLTCEDATTRDWAGGWRARAPITDGAFSFDDVAQYTAVHFEGTLRTLSGQGTVSLAIPVLTADEQAQLCTTGDLTWEVEYLRTH